MTQDDERLNRRESFSKAFRCRKCGGNTQVLLMLPSYRIVKSKLPYGAHAEYHVVVTVEQETFEVWRRYSEFKKFVQGVASEEPKYRNCICSWEVLDNGRKWYRCLDTNYLDMKCIMLQRFLKNLVYESGDPAALCHFLGLTCSAS